MELVDDWLCTGEFIPIGDGSDRPLPAMKDPLLFEYSIFHDEFNVYATF
jgi:hypothetical protein